MGDIRRRLNVNFPENCNRPLLGQPNEIIYEESDKAGGQEDLSEDAARVWTGFFLEARRLAALARERRTAREAAQETGDRPPA